MKIYCFTDYRHGLDYHVVALCECGEQLAEHTSSTIRFAKYDIGVSSRVRYHEQYQQHSDEKHSGEPYTLEWVDDPGNHEVIHRLQQISNHYEHNPQREITDFMTRLARTGMSQQNILHHTFIYALGCFGESTHDMEQTTLVMEKASLLLEQIAREVGIHNDIIQCEKRTN